MELKQDQILKYQIKFISIEQFIKEYHPGLRNETISYWITQNKIDWFRPNRERFIALTQHTLNHKPNKYGKRK